MCTQNAATEACLKAASRVEHVQSLVDQVLATYGDYSEALDNLKTSRDTKKFQNTKKQLDSRLKTVAGELPDVEKELRLLDADAADKVWYRVYGFCLDEFVVCRHVHG